MLEFTFWISNFSCEISIQNFEAEMVEQMTTSRCLGSSNTAFERHLLEKVKVTYVMATPGRFIGLECES
jgi:hypothetical protein